MPYIQVELDAIPKVAKAAKASKLEEAVIGWGLVQLWEWCWREKTDVVSEDQLLAFFPDTASRFLESFHFLEKVPEGYRVRGAEKYLRIRAGNSAGGNASKQHLVPGGGRKPSRKPRGSRGQAEGGAERDPRGEPRGSPGRPESPSRVDLGSTANSEQRAANSEQRIDHAPASPDAPGRGGQPSRFRALQERLCGAYRQRFTDGYKWQGAKDSEALKRLMGHADDDRIVALWCLGLSNIGWSSTASIAQLDMKWNDLVKAERGEKPPPRQLQGYVMPTADRGPVGDRGLG